MGLEKKEQFVASIEWFLDYLKIDRGASSHTLDAYRNDLFLATDFFLSLGCSDWTDLTAESISKYQSSLGAPLKTTTRRRRVSSLRSLLKFLKKHQKGPACELPSASVARIPKRLPKALQIDQLLALLAAPDLSTPVGLRDRALMELVYGTGLRVSEACSLKIAELELETASLRVTGKRQKTRWLPIPAQSLPWIEQYLQQGRPCLLKRPLGEIFVNAHGNKLSRSMAYRILEKYALKIGIQNPIGPHVLRHTYAVHLVKGGADLRTVQELLGHASVSTTQVYTQLDMEEVQKKYKSAHPRR